MNFKMFSNTYTADIFTNQFCNTCNLSNQTAIFVVFKAMIAYMILNATPHAAVISMIVALIV